MESIAFDKYRAIFTDKQGRKALNVIKHIFAYLKQIFMTKKFKCRQSIRV